MDFKEANLFLDGFLNYEKILHKSAVDFSNFSLDRVKNFIKVSKIDISKMKFIYVVGSKGKGGVASIIANYLALSGIKAGLFTSPHMISLTERIWINGEFVSEEEFAASLDGLKPFLDASELTYFEVLFVLALKIFVDLEMEYAVMEAGLGGRLDAINSVDGDAVVLTTVELEHTHILGDTYEKILDEKLVVRREGKPLVIAPQNSNVEEILRKRYSNDGNVFFVECNSNFAREKNAATASKILEILLGKLDNSIFKEAASFSILPGRYDFRKIGGNNVVFDMAHTISSIRNLMHSLKKDFPHQEFVFLVSIMKDKQVEAILNLLDGKKIFTNSNSERGVPAQDLAEITSGEVMEEPMEAFNKTLAELKKNEVLVVTGSHFLVAKILKELKA